MRTVKIPLVQRAPGALLASFLCVAHAGGGAASTASVAARAGAAPDAIAPTLPQGPRISIPDPEKDFGTLIQGDGVTHDFAFESAGDAPLIIEKVEVNCGCTVSEVLVGDVPYELGRQIQPGGKGVIRAHVRTGALHGALAKTIKVRSNDPSGPVELRFRAEIEPFFLIDHDPPTLVFGTVPAGETRSLSMVVRCERVPAFQIVEAGELPRGVTLRWDAVEEGKADAWRVTATLGADAAEGKLDRQILLTTDIGRTIEIYVTGNVAGPLEILPAPAVSFGAIPRGTKSSRSIEIVVRDGEPASHVTGTTLDVRKKGNEARDLSEFFEVKLSTVEEGKRYAIEIVALDTLPRGIFTGTLQLATDHPGVPKKEVTLSGSVR